ncbi:MAG: cell division protein FtsL [Castellaniella sp.]|uniref:cell division protein FtsL n=1 Tax=Castellaniella sp. TaxID=1955812 RepID=UPI003C768BE3
MIRISLFLSLLLMASAISLVTVRFQARELFVTSERLKSQAHELDTEWRRLQLERAELARNARIDSLARSELHLVAVTPGRTIYLQESPAAGPSTGGQP